MSPRHVWTREHGSSTSLLELGSFPPLQSCRNLALSWGHLWISEAPSAAHLKGSLTWGWGGSGREAMLLPDDPLRPRPSGVFTSYSPFSFFFNSCTLAYGVPISATTAAMWILYHTAPGWESNPVSTATRAAGSQILTPLCPGRNSLYRLSTPVASSHWDKAPSHVVVFLSIHLSLPPRARARSLPSAVFSPCS